MEAGAGRVWSQCARVHGVVADAAAAADMAQLPKELALPAADVENGAPGQVEPLNEVLHQLGRERLKRRREMQVGVHGRVVDHDRRVERDVAHVRAVRAVRQAHPADRAVGGGPGIGPVHTAQDRNVTEVGERDQLGGGAGVTWSRHNATFQENCTTALGQ